MNKANFMAKDNFPQSTYTLDFLQQMSHLASGLALLGGSNYILAGCVTDHIIVSDGIVVINGELLPFEGGQIKDKITIQEVKEADHYAGVDYPEAYILRKAIFSDTGEYLWNDFKQVLSNHELQKRIEAIKGDEPGVTKGWSGFISKIPKDHMLCDGRDLIIADYPVLYENIGTIYGGSADGKSFKLPNYGGRFGVCYTGTGDYKEIGMVGGEEYHQLIAEEMAKHDHTNGNTDFNKLSARAADVNELGTPSGIDDITADKEYNVGNMTPNKWIEATIRSVGENKPHENRPPYYVEAKIIKVK